MSDMPEEIYAFELEREHEEGTEIRYVWQPYGGQGGGTAKGAKYIRADRAPVDVESLEDFKHTKVGNKRNYETGFAKGWNKCIDWLAEQGYLGHLSDIGELVEGLNEVLQLTAGLYVNWFNGSEENTPTDWDNFGKGIYKLDKLYKALLEKHSKDGGATG